MSYYSTTQRNWINNMERWLEQVAAVDPEYAKTAKKTLDNQAKTLGIDPNDIWDPSWKEQNGCPHHRDPNKPHQPRQPYQEPKKDPYTEDPERTDPNDPNDPNAPKKEKIPTGPWNPPGQVNPGDPNAYDEYINEAAEKYGVDPNLIKAVIRQESNFDPNAVSASGCKGLMQLSPDKGTDAELHDPRTNIDLGTKYLKQMLDLAGGDVRRALAMYNAGPNADLGSNPAGQDHSGWAYADMVLRWKEILDSGGTL
jgi:hypothetical protein